MPRRLGGQRTEQIVHQQHPAGSTSITKAQPVADGAGPNRVECCCTAENRLLYILASDYGV